MILRTTSIQLPRRMLNPFASRYGRASSSSALGSGTESDEQPGSVPPTHYVESSLLDRSNSISERLWRRVDSSCS
jgi:hypothetical protein